MDRDILQRLLDQAFLYDDPTAYQAGVHAAWGELARVREQSSDKPPEGLGQLLRGAQASAV